MFHSRHSDAILDAAHKLLEARKLCSYREPGRAFCEAPGVIRERWGWRCLEHACPSSDAPQ